MSRWPTMPRPSAYRTTMMSWERLKRLGNRHWSVAKTNELALRDVVIKACQSRLGDRFTRDRDIAVFVTLGEDSDARGWIMAQCYRTKDGPPNR